MFVDTSQFMTYVANLLHNPPLMFITGFFTLILGILLVVGHNIWVWNWRVIVTLISWIVLIKGISIIVYPHVIDKASFYFIRDINMAYAGMGFNFIIGLVLVYFGYRTEKVPKKTRQKSK